MAWTMKRRDFLKSAVGGCALCAGCSGPLRMGGWGAVPACDRISGLVSPGCRGTKVRVAKIYLGTPQAHWPTPTMDLNAEMKRYEAEFAKRPKDFADIDFVCNQLVSSAEQAKQVCQGLKDVDGVLLIHLSMRAGGFVHEFLQAGKPTMLFAAPYSGHEWISFGSVTKSKEGALLDCVLTSDLDQLAAAVRPFRAIHHLKEAKLINVSTRPMDANIVAFIQDKFGTQVKQIGREPVLAAYESVPEADAQAETNRLIWGAQRIVEPSREEIYKSCRLALAFQKVLDDEKATAITVDCYGTMYHQLPAFPCVGEVRLNGLGLAGICESDLRTAITFMMLQALTGRPGFVSDPTMDLSQHGIILAHCLGTPKMAGPDGPAAPYRLRSIMERQEGAVPQVFMRVGQRVTQAEFIGNDMMQYFTGTIVDAPDTDRGCRTKITIKVDGDADALWRNWSNGLHRVTCYGDVTEDLRRFCKFKGIRMIDEAAKA